jgi:lipid-A-disaccharide synthase
VSAAGPPQGANWPPGGAAQRRQSQAWGDHTSSPVTIGIVAGEASGDALGAALIQAVRRRRPAVGFAGIAGPRMEAAGCEIWAPLEALAVRGFSEVIAHLPALVALRREIARRFITARIPVFVGVDAPDFNLGLERRLKRRRIRTVHFVSPSVWAWRRERLQSIGRGVDRMLALFPFEPPLYEAAGIAVDYVGHPLAQEAAGAGTRRAMRETLKEKPATPLFALLPGSRLSEIEMHGGLVLDTAARIVEARPVARFVVPLVSRTTRDAFLEVLHRGGHDALPLTVLYGHAGNALRAADVALVASGTATLEAALARCPHVIFYRVSALTARIVRRKLLVPWVGLPNVLAGRFVVPELLQDDATPGNLAQAALNLFDDTVTRRRIEAVFGHMGEALSVDTGALAADAVLAELDHATGADGARSRH